MNAVNKEVQERLSRLQNAPACQKKPPMSINVNKHKPTKDDGTITTSEPIAVYSNTITTKAICHDQPGYTAQLQQIQMLENSVTRVLRCKGSYV